MAKRSARATGKQGQPDAITQAETARATQMLMIAAAGVLRDRHGFTIEQVADWLEETNARFNAMVNEVVVKAQQHGPDTDGPAV